MDDYTQAILRHGLSAAGGILITKGLADQAQVEALLGGVMALITIGWSLWQKKGVRKLKAAIATQDNPLPDASPGQGQGLVQGPAEAVKRPTNVLPLFMAAAVMLATAGCGKATLELGGAYSPVTTNAAGEVVPASQADIGFYAVDAAFDLAYSTAQTAFAFERNNRQMLWAISPAIKHSLDQARPAVVDVWRRYALARKAYKANPVPANLPTLQAIMAEMQNLSAAAAAALPPVPPNAPTLQTPAN